MAHQLKWQHAHKAAGLCCLCSVPALTVKTAAGKTKTFAHCPRHVIARRDRQARKFGCKKTYNCASRQAENKLKKTA